MKTNLVPRRERGVAAVEFALIAGLFFTILIAVMEMGRLMWTWNAAVEATRLGARLAVVCDYKEETIWRQMRERLPALTDKNINITYLNALGGACSTSESCREVRVALTGYVHKTLIPIALLPGPQPLGPLAISLPPFETTLRKEFMQSANNPVCY